MRRSRPDKSPVEIRYLLNRKGMTFADVDRTYGLPAGTCRRAARAPHPDGELAIAEVLSVSPRQLWPFRFDPETRLRLKPQPIANYRHPFRLRDSQNGEAA